MLLKVASLSLFVTCQMGSGDSNNNNSAHRFVPVQIAKKNHPGDVVCHLCSFSRSNRSTQTVTSAQAGSLNAIDQLGIKKKKKYISVIRRWLIFSDSQLYLPVTLDYD